MFVIIFTYSIFLTYFQLFPIMYSQICISIKIQGTSTQTLLATKHSLDSIEVMQIIAYLIPQAISFPIFLGETTIDTYSMAYKRSIGEYVYMQNSDMLFKIYVSKVLHFLYDKSQREKKNRTGIYAHQIPSNVKFWRKTSIILYLDRFLNFLYKTLYKV